MPEMDGITALAKLRQVSNVPVILLTAKSEDTDKILGLNVGADDYITKPFNRWRWLPGSQPAAAVLPAGGRCTPAGGADPGHYPDGRPGEDRRRGWGSGSSDAHGVRYSEAAAGAPGQVFSPREIYRKVWKDAPFGSENTVAVHIRRPAGEDRDRPGESRYLKVVWGQGYKLEKGMRT